MPRAPGHAATIRLTKRTRSGKRVRPVPTSPSPAAGAAVPGGTAGRPPWRASSEPAYTRTSACSLRITLRRARCPWWRSRRTQLKGGESAGIQATLQAVSDLTGVAINYYAETDYWGLQDIVDAVGGIGSRKRPSSGSPSRCSSPATSPRSRHWSGPCPSTW
ncbi:LCP family protein [Alicyclobacillus macrosporangiidus]|uniref:LCP family glycopolymer transferase n=1 Tax=Alicyclobacillus macrosporangiidus TaxID=392015 RepID=UPI0009DEFFBE